MLTVTTDKTHYRLGEPVQITLTLTNRSDQQVVCYFNTAQRYDIVVSQAGREVWRWSNDRSFAQVTGSLTLSPGQSVEYTERWNGQDNQGTPVTPGTYTITAQITSIGRSAHFAQEDDRSSPLH